MSATPSAELTIEEIYQAVDDLREAGATDDEVISFKSQHGIQTISKETVTVDRYGNEVSPDQFSILALNPGYHTVTNWVDYLEQGTYAGKYAIYAEQERAEGSAPGTAWGEEYPASYDVVGISWDPSVFQYVASMTLDSNSNWLQDVSNRLDGTVLFSLKDNFGFFTSSWVIVNKLQSNVNTSTAVKYTHTYDKTKTRTTYSGNAS
ncbi:hypothetical protein M6D81_09125 [Paenibacillus sp. J5C_2022]|uniref:hypothetical protein n=1 Tax=Paenibacillus sp. J5C2022 TaxID=2977129 RepID=UPI0021D0EA92|nr:hypothetical protein [Paenibacillus sp. J5C2022]MCU6708881.1 hypothetical protein [Paenibacillus sp. J5C2022]